MTSRIENARKRKEKPEAVVSSGSDDDQNKRKARRVSTDAAASNAASLQVDTPVVTEENTAANTASTEHEESIQSIGKMIRDLFHSDNAKVNATLNALYLNLDKDKKKCESLVTVGGCHALVQLLEKCLDKATIIIPACDQVTEMNELDELKTLHEAFSVIMRLTFQHDESRFGIAAIGGVEAVVKVMKTFPRCQALQERACAVLGNLATCNLGKKNAVKSGGLLQLLLAAINNHLDSAKVCEYVCFALYNIVKESKEHIELLISMGGATAVAKVRKEWPDEEDVQPDVQRLAKLIGTEMNSWADKE
jgi:hypothetical protein